MSFDLPGQLFGKARRRAIEVKWNVLLPRVAAPAAVYLITEIAKGNVPRDAHTLALLGAGALGVVILKSPDAFQAAGVVRSVSPETKSIAQGIGAALTATAKQKQQVSLQAAVAEEVRALAPALADLAAQQVWNRTNMGGLAAGDLTAAQVGRPTASDAHAGESGSVQAETTPSSTPTTSTPINEDAAIAATGGNQ